MPDTYYGVLVNIAQDPATHTCQETFGLLTREEEAQLIKWIDLNHGWSACTANRETKYVERMGARDGT